MQQRFDSLVFIFNCSLRKIILSCNHLTKRSELLMETLLALEFSISSSIQVLKKFLNLNKSLFALIGKVSLLRLLLLEYWPNFRKERRVQVPKSSVFTEWLYTNASNKSLKISIVTSFSTDSYTKRKSSSLPHSLLLRFKVCTAFKIV